MKTESEVYNEVLNYIKSDKHNRPCTLQSIKKILRSQRIVDLIFSRPDIFKLESEFKHVPTECMTENVLVKFVLANSDNFNQLDESLQAIPVLVAFEFAKRREERFSRAWWGPYYERKPYTGKMLEYRDAISNICDQVLKTISPNPDESYILRDYLKYIEIASKQILEYCNSLNQELQKEEKYTAKYFGVSFDTDERIFIFVSGRPDTGKTSFSNILASRICNSVHLDSDVLLERNLICAPLDSLLSSDTKVVIFSDIYADRFFKKEELGEAKVINILMEPVSIEAMHRNSKYMSRIPFEEYKRHEIDKIRYDNLENPIIVTNNYSGTIAKEADKALEEISQRLEVALLSKQPDVIIGEVNSTPLKKMLKPIYTPSKN
ncbi:MAG: hypothetical protein IJE89_02525 [Bacilli bacterium]|nr:hypothetical protein [Bacilli bacterium]